MKESQRERVLKKLRHDGYITRNECLRNYISRLGAIICDLKKDGYDFKTEDVKGDYKYTLINEPHGQANPTTEQSNP